MKLKIHLHRYILVVQIMLLMVPFMMPFNAVQAQDLTPRSVGLSSSTVGGPATHTFSFTVKSPVVMGSIAFEYCANSPLTNVPCIAPVGLNLTNMALSGQTGNTGFTIDGSDSTPNKIVITRAPSAASTVSSSYSFSGIINPTTVNKTTFVRIATYISTDSTGAPTDSGSVAFAVTQNFKVSAFVPPFLTFCVGVSVTINCNSTLGTHIDIGELQKNTTATATMQFSGATNDATGYTTYLNGFTMTSGNNIINPLATGGSSTTGTSQFGLNLRANTSPVVGQEPIGPGSSAPNAGYSSANNFRFVDGEILTNSATSTDFKLFTASFIVNIPANQPPGVYATTMTYTATASF